MMNLMKDRKEWMEKADRMEREQKLAEDKSDELQKEVEKIAKEINALEDKLDKTMEQYRESSDQLDIARKTATDSELEVNAQTRKMQLIEEEMQRVTERLDETCEKLEVAEKAAEDSERGRKVIESRSYKDEETLELQEIQLRDAQVIAEDSDLKYEEVSRKLRMVETDLERIEDRADEFEGKYKVYHDELTGLNAKAKKLEEICGKNAEAEDNYESEIHRLTEEVKNAETRAEFAERTLDKLEKNIDYLEDQLYAEKCAYKEMSEKLDITLGDMVEI